MCEICGRIGECAAQCPNYVNRHWRYCSICDNRIQNGEYYIENVDGEVIHYDCIRNLRSFIEWLGYSVEEYEEEEL